MKANSTQVALSSRYIDTKNPQNSQTSVSCGFLASLLEPFILSMALVRKVISFARQEVAAISRVRPREIQQPRAVHYISSVTKKQKPPEAHPNPLKPRVRAQPSFCCGN